MLTGVQQGGVLKMRSGAVKFEAVTISDTTAEGVRVAAEADRAGGGCGCGVQDGGVVKMDGGSVEFKGGSIARSSAVHDPRC